MSTRSEGRQQAIGSIERQRGRQRTARDKATHQGASRDNEGQRRLETGANEGGKEKRVGGRVEQLERDQKRMSTHVAKER